MAEDAEVGGNADRSNNKTGQKITSFLEVKHTYEISNLFTL